MGAAGQQGLQGIQGIPGIQGPIGLTGPAGAAGNPATNLVTSVNGQQGVVNLTADHVGAYTTTQTDSAILTSVSGYLKADGSSVITGDFNLNSHTISDAPQITNGAAVIQLLNGPYFGQTTYDRGVLIGGDGSGALSIVGDMYVSGGFMDMGLGNVQNLNNIDVQGTLTVGNTAGGTGTVNLLGSPLNLYDGSGSGGGMLNLDNGSIIGITTLYGNNSYLQFQPDRLVIGSDTGIISFGGVPNLSLNDGSGFNGGTFNVDNGYIRGAQEITVARSGLVDNQETFQLSPGESVVYLAYQPVEGTVINFTGNGYSGSATVNASHAEITVPSAHLIVDYSSCTVTLGSGVTDGNISVGYQYQGVDLDAQVWNTEGIRCSAVRVLDSGEPATPDSGCILFCENQSLRVKFANGFVSVLAFNAD